MAIKLADTARPNNYVDSEHLGTFPVAYAEDVWFADGTRLSEKTFDGQSIQKEELPLASADELGNIYQYVGESGTYEHGCFYECVSDGEATPTYSWKAVISAGDSIQKESLPVASEEEVGNIYQYIGETTGTLVNGYFYKCKSSGGSTPVYSWEETDVSRTYKTISRNPAGGSSGLDAGFMIGNFIDVTDAVDKEINSYLLTLINNVNNSISIILQTTYDNYLGYGVKAIAIEDNNNMIEKIPKFVYNDTQKYIFFILPRSWRQQDTTISLMQIGGKKMDFRLTDASGGYTGANVTFHNVENLKKTFTGTQAEWDALTTDKKKTYNIVNITDDDSGANLDYYSTTETKTNKVWIDGKPIYRKVVITGSASSDTTFATNLPDSVSDYWIDIGHSYFIPSNSNVRIPVSYPHPIISAVATTWLLDKDTIQLRLGESQSVSKMVIVIEYTKEG